MRLSRAAAIDIGWVEVLEDVAELEEVRCWTLTLPVTSTLFLAGLNFLLSGQVL